MLDFEVVIIIVVALALVTLTAMSEKFRRLLLGILVMITLIVGMCAVRDAAAEETYNRVGFICDVDEDEDIIVIMDSVGFIWIWEGVEDFDLYDVVVFDLYPQGKSEYILDDAMGQPTYTAMHLDPTWVQTMLDTYYK